MDDTIVEADDIHNMAKTKVMLKSAKKTMSSNLDNPQS